MKKKSDKKHTFFWKIVIRKNMTSPDKKRDLTDFVI